MRGDRGVLQVPFSPLPLAFPSLLVRSSQSRHGRLASWLTDTEELMIIIIIINNNDDCHPGKGADHGADICIVDRLIQPTAQKRD